MAGITRTLTFSEGVETTGPTTTFLQTTQFATYADDATYVSNKGSAAADGDAYYNTTTDVIRLYADGSWQTVYDDSDANVALLTGAQTFSGAKTFSSAVNITDTTNATSKDTGALIVEGGIGVEKDVYIGGDLTVDGTTTTINTETLDVEDANVTVNKGGDQATADSNDAGLTVEMSDATDALMHYDSTATSKWKAGESGSQAEVTTISHAQQLTNKDYDGGTASNTSRITLPKAGTSTLDGLTRKQGTLVYDTDLEKPFYDDGTNLNEIGGGAGGINYIDNPDAEGGITGWSEFDDSSDYIDGSGGTAANLTLSQNGTTPLRGSYDFDIAIATSVNAQYEGVSTDFTIDKADKYSVLSISFDYLTDAPDDYFSVRIYDVTNSTIIYPTPQDILAHANETKFVSQFQTSDSTSYRLSIFVNDSDATHSGYNFNFDNVVVGPTKKLIGTPITDWESFTPTGTWTTNVTYYGQKRRVGGDLEVTGRIDLSGATDATALQIDLPSGHVMDTTKMEADTDNRALGTGSILSVSGNARYYATYSYVDNNTVGAYHLDDDGTSAKLISVTNTVPVTFANTDQIFFSYKVPISGWGSNVKMADIDSNRSIEAAGAGNGGGAVTVSVTNIDFTETLDNSGSFDGTTFTLPESGSYAFSGSMLFTTTSNRTPSLYVNGNFNKAIGSKTGNGSETVGFSSIYKGTKGDQLTFRVEANGGTLWNVSTFHTINIRKLNNRENILASDRITSYHTSDAGQSIARLSWTTVVFEQKIFDDFNMVNTSNGEVTIPVTGTYLIGARLDFVSAAWTVGQGIAINAYLNGNPDTNIDERLVDGSVTTIKNAGNFALRQYTKGDVVTLRVFHTCATTPLSLSTTGNYQNVSLYLAKIN